MKVILATALIVSSISTMASNVTRPYKKSQKKENSEITKIVNKINENGGCKYAGKVNFFEKKFFSVGGCKGTFSKNAVRTKNDRMNRYFEITSTCTTVVLGLVDVLLSLNEEDSSRAKALERLLIQRPV